MELNTSFMWSWGDNEPKLIVSTVFSFSQYTVWLQIGRRGFDAWQGQKDFSSSLFVQTSFYAHPASCTTGAGVLPRGESQAGAWRWPRLVPRSEMSRSYTPFPLGACMTVAGQLYFTQYYWFFSDMCPWADSCRCPFPVWFYTATSLQLSVLQFTATHLINKKFPIVREP
jgi:hypothetical protein